MLKRRRTEQDEILTRRDARSRGERPPEQSGPTPNARRRRKRRRLSFFRQLAVAAGILVAGYASLPILLRAGRMQPIVEERLSQSLGRRVRIGSLRFSPTFGSLVATDVSVADDPAFSSAPFLHAEQMDLTVRRLPLIFRREIELNAVSLEQPTITLIRNGSQWNFHALLAAGPPIGDTTPGPNLRVRQGILVVRADAQHDPVVLHDISFESARFSTALQNPVSLSSNVRGGGTLKLTGTMGPVSWQGRSPVIPLNLLVNARKLALADSNALEEIAPAVDGLMALDGAIESDGTDLQVSGNGEFQNLRLSAAGAPAVEPLGFSFGLSYDFGSRTGSLSRCDLNLSKGSATLKGKYSLGDDGAFVKLALAVQGAPVTSLAGLLPSSGVPLPSGTSLQGGLAFVDLNIEGNLKAPLAGGSVTLNNTKLIGFDLEDRLSSVDGLDLLHISRDVAIDEWRSNVNVTPERVGVTGLEILLPELGVLRGNGTIDLKGTLDFEMSAVRTGVSEKRSIPFVVRGACVSPIFRGPGKAS